jgi:hypothetical protein
MDSGMSPLLVIDAARAAASIHSKNQDARLAFHVGYLESAVFELCDILAQAEKVMQAQKNLIERMEKGVSASL